MTAGQTVASEAGAGGGRSRFDRLLKPTTIALVGLSDTNPMQKSIQPTFDSDAEIFFVNPRYDTVLGKPAYDSLTDIGRPVDAVMACVNANVTTDLVEEAAGLDIGGVVLVANGFSEFGDEGADLQTRLKAAAHGAGLPVIGPNGVGYINVPLGISLCISAHHKRRVGGISIVSHSGAMLSGAAMASWNYPDTGLNLLISAGNEAATTMADYIDYFVEDPDTKTIGLIMEKIRDPEGFFAAVDRATEAGKPIVVLKLARTERSQKLAASHTGALTGDAWVYDVALKQAGVALAYDIEEMLDRLAIAEQLPRERWTAVSSMAVVTRTGGFASLSADLAEAEGIPLAPLEHFNEWLAETIPGSPVANPLDAGTFGGRKKVTWAETVAKYATDPEVDAVFMIHPSTVEDVEGYRNEEGEIVGTPIDDFAAAAALVEKPCVISNCSATPGDWVESHLGALVRGNGLRGSMRGLSTLGAFVRHRGTPREDVEAKTPIARPAATPVAQPEGPMLPFAAAMDLLAENGIPVAPFHVVFADADPSSATPSFNGPYVVKLADVAHRTEHNAVRLGVDQAGLAAAIADLRSIAETDGLAASVAIQPMVEIQGEALLGIQGESELGPLVVFGLGGILVEVLNKVGGRMAPFSHAEARGLIEEFAELKVMHGFRGRPAWDLDALTEILFSAGQLAARGRDWIASVDINPLVYGPNGFQAVDALVLLKQ